MSVRKPVEATELNDTLIRHNVFVQRYASGEVNKFSSFLKQTDRAVRAQLSGDEVSDFTKTRLQSLLTSVDNTLTAVLAKNVKQLALDLQDFAAHESGFVGRALGNILQVNWAAPAETQLRAAVLSSPLSVRGPQGGKLLKELIKDWSTAERKTVTGIIRRGAFEGQTNSQIIRSIRGTAAQKYADGALNTSARNAAAVVRTAVQHVSTVARQETFDRNADIVEGVQWVATLDKRTCPRCGALDGLVFKGNKGLRPPLHIQCRCTVIPVLSDEFKGLDKGATRASKGAEGGAQVAADETYFDWLKRQPPSFQDAAIGPARAKLLRDGGLSASRFAQLQLDKNFEPLTLEEMKSLEPLAFERAGVAA